MSRQGALPKLPLQQQRQANLLFYFESTFPTREKCVLCEYKDERQCTSAGSHGELAVSELRVCVWCRDTMPLH